ncbi:hypothetical protein [Athalassotoga saccharophila]|uniref:hypothetical protein n=1 Tax=Athalassotoga saccharophila TaxID=1441386 RepID=UPI00137A766E|nr:hypothetical protein [Athalassotoga saccharophila]BBJ27143.1 hypothetical protein ATHSA_0010 [Athalassotoga saccharophila]
MKKRWTLFNVSWLIAFVILLSYLMGIALIGFAFLIVAGVFLWLLYRSKSEAPWVVWIIPYFFSIIIFLWFFNGGNFLNFVFHNFYLLLKDWFSYPFPPSGSTIILAIVSYFVVYLVSANIRKKFNSSIVLAITAATIGIVAQFINPFVTLGMATLFLFSIVLNSLYDGIIHRSTLKMVGIILIAFLAIFFVTLTVRPISPLQNVFTFSPSTPTTVHASPSRVIVHMQSVPVSPQPAKNISSTFYMEWVYNILLYTVGIFSIASSAIFIYFFIKYRETRKKNIKGLITVIWMIVSILFIFVLVLYFIGIPKHSVTPPLEMHEHEQGITYLASISNATPVKVTNYSIPPFFFLVILFIVGAVVVMIIYNVFKYGIPIERAGEKEESEGKQDFEFKKEDLNFSGPPDKTVLFYYNVLRKKIGDPSLTPYEFADYLSKYVEKSTSEKMTEIFVKLRYARKKITEEESQFFKETVTSILKL